jgi:Spy/CpxP family protein refolding chaperone
MFGKHLHPRARIVGLASGLALALGSAAVLAQPGPGFGHRGPNGAGGEPIAQIIEQYKTQLALDSLQQEMWNNAVAATQRARQNGRALMQQVHDSMQAELAKPEPDIDVIAKLTDDAQAQGQALRKPARDAWLTLYRNLTPQQKTVVRDALVQRMQRHEQMWERMRQRSSGQG